MASPGPSHRARIGSKQDVEERIRRFYKFWYDKQPDAQGLSPEDIDIESNAELARREFRHLLCEIRTSN